MVRIQSDNLTPPAVINDPILNRFHAAVDEVYGDRIEYVVLFGSRARGDAFCARSKTDR